MTSTPASTSGVEILVRQVARIGVMTLEREADRYFVAIRNRSYRSRHEVPVEAARRWWRYLNSSGQ